MSDMKLWQSEGYSSIISVAHMGPSTDTAGAKAVSEAHAKPF